MSNLDRFKKDIDSLIAKGKQLEQSMQRECMGKEFDAQIKKRLGDKSADLLKALPSFTGQYQTWYSEALAVIKQLLPDRVPDFTRHYEKPKSRKQITWENYHLEDYLQGLKVTRGYEKEVVVDTSAAIPRFQQQLSILEATKQRFESSLFDIRQLVQADLFDSELDAARELAKQRFGRAAGAVAGVLLEKHLAQVCDAHAVKISKKNPTIADFNDALKNSNVIETAQWRFNQHLADLRNLCDHNKKVEPTPEQIQDLLDGVAKVMKTVL
jgi:predicted nucleic acid-binding protein